MKAIKKIFTAVLLMATVAASAQNKTERLKLADEIDRSIRTELLINGTRKVWIVYMEVFSLRLRIIFYQLVRRIK